MFLPSLLVTYYHLSPSQNGLVFLPLSLSVVLGSVVGGRLQERSQPKRFLVLTASLNVLATLVFALVVAISLPVLLMSLAFFGICLGLSLPVQTTLSAWQPGRLWAPISTPSATAWSLWLPRPFLA